ncbi:hypothetical protein sS8_2317 [Methylocaldum marinum]|uniref:Siderophore-interacting protein n=1 Tax=Methylocaldum marinum TaxID=1432792 RepID=A0A250KWX0_9GAMM|nr:SIP domain-containing protein [Methylocaldum marinum]BBA34269.1 hypothetical protein sS8_2317 [Methylocaldum marinum]
MGDNRRSSTPHEGFIAKAVGRAAMSGKDSRPIGNPLPTKTLGRTVTPEQGVCETRTLFFVPINPAAREISGRYAPLRILPNFELNVQCPLSLSPFFAAPRRPTVRQTERLSPHLLRVRFFSEELHDFPDAGPGAHLKLFVPLPRRRGGLADNRARRAGVAGRTAPGRLPDAVRGIDWPSSARIFATVAGENDTVLAIRRHLRRDRGVPAESLYAVPYWRRGRKEEDYHDERHRLMETDS